MENKLVYSILAFAIKGIVSGKETVHTMRSSDNIVKSWERVQTYKPYRISAEACEASGFSGSVMLRVPLSFLPASGKDS